MDRRRFLLATASLSAAGLVGGFATSLRAAETSRAASHRLLRLDSTTQRFRPLANAPGVQPHNALRLHIDAFQSSPESSLTTLRMEALFGEAQAPWRHLAWHYTQGDAFGSSRAAGFDLGAGAFQGLALQWKTRNLAQPLHCVAAQELAALGPGRYLLVLGGDALLVNGLPFSGDWQRPLNQACADCFSLRVEAVQAVADLAARADLASLGCVDETQTA